MTDIGQVNGVDIVTPKSGSINDKETLQQTMDDFLLLLTTQMQNQDPLEPMDSEKFTDQLLNFSGIEQQINTNTKLDQLLDLTSYNQTMGMVDYIGTTIEYSSNQLSLSSGQASFNYTLSNNSAATIIAISDQNGNIVRSLDGETEAGDYSLQWDGKDADGNQLPDGIYNLTIKAVDQSGATVDGSMSMIGRVTGVESQNGVIQLLLGNLPVDLSQVVGVHESSSEGDPTVTDPTDSDTSPQA
jgi:flagellar basal-body rod modification protein FlgD|tara:strand:+ start:24166 stop:24894 length:729 start_codon:yes stop_codon:yes gene_type:complete